MRWTAITDHSDRCCCYYYY